MHTTFARTLGVIGVMTSLSQAPTQAAPTARLVDFEKDIQPIFKERCLDCHGPDKKKVSFRVDQHAVMLSGGDSGIAALVPGNPAKSHLLELIKSSDEDEVMPPKGKPLTAEQIALIEKRIAEGAVVPVQMDAVVEAKTDLWSFQPVKRPDVPEKAANPVDAFLNAKLKESGLKANGGLMHAP